MSVHPSWGKPAFQDRQLHLFVRIRCTTKHPVYILIRPSVCRLYYKRFTFSTHNFLGLATHTQVVKLVNFYNIIGILTI